MGGLVLDGGRDRWEDTAGMVMLPVCRAETPLTGRKIREGEGGVLPVYRNMGLVKELPLGRGQAGTGVERPLQDHCGKHFVSGVRSTVMGQAQLGDGASGTWRLAGVMGQAQLGDGASGTWTRKRRSWTSWTRCRRRSNPPSP